MLYMHAMVTADYSIWNFVVIVCYFALASGHSVWGLAFKRGAVSSAPAGLLQQLQLLLFEIELPVRLPAQSRSTDRPLRRSVWFYV